MGECEHIMETAFQSPGEPSAMETTLGVYTVMLDLRHIISELRNCIQATFPVENSSETKNGPTLWEEYCLAMLTPSQYSNVSNCGYIDSTTFSSYSKHLEDDTHLTDPERINRIRHLIDKLKNEYEGIVHKDGLKTGHPLKTSMDNNFAAAASVVDAIHKFVNNETSFTLQHRGPLPSLRMPGPIGQKLLADQAIKDSPSDSTGTSTEAGTTVSIPGRGRSRGERRGSEGPREVSTRYNPPQITIDTPASMGNGTEMSAWWHTFGTEGTWQATGGMTSEDYRTAALSGSSVCASDLRPIDFDFCTATGLTHMVDGVPRTIESSSTLRKRNIEEGDESAPTTASSDPDHENIKEGMVELAHMLKRQAYSFKDILRGEIHALEEANAFQADNLSQVTGANKSATDHANSKQLSFLSTALLIALVGFTFFCMVVFIFTIPY